MPAGAPSPSDHLSPSPSDQLLPSSDVRLAPPPEKSLAAIHAEMQRDVFPRPDSHRPTPLSESIPPPPSQYSLRDLIILVTMVSVGLAGVKWFTPSTYAGVMGIVSVCWLIMAFKLDSPWTQLVWWGLFVTYLLAVLVAMIS
jgi:hypothetical protein